MKLGYKSFSNQSVEKNQFTFKGREISFQDISHEDHGEKLFFH